MPVSVRIVDVPGYRLAERIGAGATGEVFRATRIADGVEVAVKVLRGRDGDDLRRVHREARRAADVDHPGVVRVHEVGGGTAAWLVMDLVPGPDLQRLLDEDGPLPPARAAGLVADIADAVAAVHAAGVVHRDLKPSNILLRGDRPVVTDFGVARTATAGAADLTGGSEWAGTATGAGAEAAPGTYAYMAPEQWRGEPGDRRCDVYALGCVLHAALTGRRPFEHRSLPELAFAVAMAPPPRTGAHPGLDHVVATAMDKDPDRRYADAGAFAAAVRAAASGRPPRRPSRRATRVAALVVAVVVAAVAAVLWTLAHRDGGAEDRVVCAETVMVRDAPRSRDVVVTLRRGEPVHLDGERDGPWVRVALPGGRTGWALVDYLATTC
ncbi:serine/threonine protein kinase [Saccharothrix yanglingensis]|uniref:serine/threonine protein kinase n=1 Tax=Saccharothrix yanglingensis TaxID=659496 RepID=UPI0027D2F9DA|nr:serine/threonine protein kinase [Saccharothrix yanglingensis]